MQTRSFSHTKFAHEHSLSEYSCLISAVGRNMNAALDAAWRTASPPFHDKTIAVTDYVPLSTMSRVLQSIVQHVAQYFPAAELRVADDWHAHDGFVVEGQPIALSDLVSLVASPRLLKEKSPEDFAVYFTVFPTSLDFLLRFRVVPADEVPEEEEEVGEFDFTGYGNDVLEVTKRLSDFPGLDCRVSSASEYFSTTYAG